MMIELSALLSAAESGDAAIEQLLAGRSLPLVDEGRVTFIYHGRADNVYLQHWVFGLPAQIPFIRLGETNWWRLEIELPLNSRVEYKLGVRVGPNEIWIHDPRNPRIAHDPFGGNSVVQMSGYVEPEWSVFDERVPRGTLETWRMPSKALSSEREIRVYLPSRFRPNRRHRLLVVHDGDDYLRYSRLSVVLDNLLYRWEIPPLVVVFLNPGDRLAEYGADRRHARFIVEELLPELQRRYPLIDNHTARALVGASFGAVAALSTAWYYPSTFDMLLLQSGSFAFSDVGLHSRGPEFDPVVSFMSQFREEAREPAKRIYVSCGVYESLIYENRSLVPLLQARGIEVQFEETRDGHNWENWRDRLRNGLTWLFPIPLWFYYE